MDALGLSEFPCSSVGICHTSIYIGLGLEMMKELDLKLALRMTKRPHMMKELWVGRLQCFKPWSDP